MLDISKKSNSNSKIEKIDLNSIDISTLLSKGIDNCQFLLAMPSIIDGFFHQSVVLIIRETDKYMLGIVINKPINFGLSKLLINIDKQSINKYLNHNSKYALIGGPVELDFIWALHLSEKKYGATLKINEQYSFTSFTSILSNINEEILKLQPRIIATNLIAVGVGLSKWDKTQLENEIKFNSWWRFSYSLHKILQLEPKICWSKIVYLLGVDPSNFYDSEITTYQ